jgi:archaellum biogenesis ATPase FlaH
MTTTGITASNYFIEVERIGVETLPETLKKGHDLVVKSTSNGTNWANYQNSEGIKKVIDLYFQKLNEYANTVSPKSTTPEPPKGKKPPVKKTEQKAKAKTAKETKEPKNVKHVEHIREEVKFIKRYVGLHNKVKSPSTILAFIKALQRSIVQKLIRKTSPLSEEIEMIQNKLVQAYNKMKGDESFAINDKDLNHLVAIAGGEKVYQSITAIKRYIGLQGKDDQKKINDFIKYLENLVDKKKLTKDDPYADKVNAIYKSLRQRSSSKVSISKAELNGLEGIVKACGCKNEVGRIYDTGGKKLRPCKSKTYSDASRGACSHNRGLSGVLTAEEMATRKLDLLNFFSFWHSLFGNPARNFTMMFHGEPHNGKTIFLLKLAQYLAENFGDVLYVSSEEFASPTMTKKVNEFLNPLPSRLHFAENLQDPDLSHYQFIILDSVNDLGLKINEYKELRKEHPDKAFIFILQHTKAGDFKGGKDWEHIAEIAGEVHKGVVNITKNRYAPKSTLDFFRQFGIQWQEPMAKQKLKPYPINGDMTTKDSQHY